MSRISAVLLCLCSLGGPAAFALTDKLDQLQAHFDHEPRAQTKVKLLEKLGEAEFAASTAAAGRGDFSTVGLSFEKYRDNVRGVFSLLKKQDPNVDKHSEGYRHLELQARRAIREVEDILIVVPAEVRPPLQIVRADLVQIDDELIQLLFPRRSKPVEKHPPAPATVPEP